MLNGVNVALAVGLLIILAILAYVAGLQNQGTAADNLWKAFQTLFGVIVGWLGGEAVGSSGK